MAKACTVFYPSLFADLLRLIALLKSFAANKSNLLAIS